MGLGDVEMEGREGEGEGMGWDGERRGGDGEGRGWDRCLYNSEVALELGLKSPGWSQIPLLGAGSSTWLLWEQLHLPVLRTLVGKVIPNAMGLPSVCFPWTG